MHGLHYLESQHARKVEKDRWDVFQHGGCRCQHSPCHTHPDSI